MKSPTELAVKLAQQWQQADYREQRLLQPSAWPVVLPIGKPSAQEFALRNVEVSRHVQRWRQMTVGRVIFQSVSYRAGSEPVEIPLQWVLHSPTEWVAATDDAQVAQEYRILERLVETIDAGFHRLLIRQRSLWRNHSEQAVIQAARVALQLSPGCADGKPLRALTIGGIDTKFFERHENLLVHLLDERFDGVASERGLAAFLGAMDDRDHWLLVAPLSDELLPFTQQRVRASELHKTALPASHILVAENENCLHQLPPLSDTIAILGAGLNLSWMQAAWLKDRRVGYWGDMDTWGLLMLARARKLQPHLDALLMTRALFDAHAADMAVPEPTVADETPPSALRSDEQDFYRYLRNSERGRLEQEFLPTQVVHGSLLRWHTQ